MRDQIGVSAAKRGAEGLRTLPDARSREEEHAVGKVTPLERFFCLDATNQLVYSALRGYARAGLSARQMGH